MSGPQFFQTPMGRKFYERDVPDIAKQLERIADALEKQNEADKSYNMKVGDPITIGGEEEIKKYNVVYHGKNDRKYSMLIEARSQEEVERIFSERYAKLDRHIAYIENWTDDEVY